jgi:hypothetical protein
LSPFLCPFYWRDDNDGDGDGDDDEGDDEGDGDGILLDAQKIVNWLGGQTRTHRRTDNFRQRECVSNPSST